MRAGLHPKVVDEVAEVATVGFVQLMLYWAAEDDFY